MSPALEHITPSHPKSQQESSSQTSTLTQQWCQEFPITITRAHKITIPKSNSWMTNHNSSIQRKSIRKETSFLRLKEKCLCLHLSHLVPVHIKPILYLVITWTKTLASQRCQFPKTEIPWPPQTPEEAQTPLETKRECQTTTVITSSKDRWRTEATATKLICRITWTLLGYYPRRHRLMALKLISKSYKMDLKILFLNLVKTN